MYLPSLEVERFERWEVGKEFLSALELFLSEPLGSGSQDRQESAVAGDLGSNLAAKAGEVMSEHTHGVEAIGHDAGLGEPTAHELSVTLGEVDTNNLDLVPSGQGS